MERFDVAEAGRQLGISRHTVRSLIRRRELGAYRVGRRIVLDEDNISRYLAAHRILGRHEAGR